MATQSQLRSRIRELERQLADLTRSQEELRQRMEGEQRMRLDQMQRQLQQTLERERSRWNEEYARRSRALREELAAEMQRQTEEIRQFDAQTNARRDELMRTLQQVNEELAQQLQELRQQEQERTESGRAVAGQIAEEAEAKRQEVDALPHEFFCTGRFAVLSEHLGQVSAFINQGMNESAASSADMCLAEFEILEIDVREQQRAWEHLFEEYRRQAVALHAVMRSFEEEPVPSPMSPGAFFLEDEDRADWSRGVYATVKDDIEQAYRLVQGADEAESITSYLRQKPAPTARELVRSITALNRLSDRLTATIVGIRNELAFSDHREMLAQAAAQLLAGQGIHVVSEGYANDDPLDSYVMELSGNGTDIVRLTMVPVRKDGVVERTECLVSLELAGIQGAEHVEGMATTIVELLKQGFGTVVEVRWDGQKALPMEVEEQRLKAVPDIRLLARRYERKFQ